MNSKAFENAIMVDLALGGSTNTVLHIPAIANDAGIKLPLETFDRLKKTPYREYAAGGELYGRPGLRRRYSRGPETIETEVKNTMTVSGKTVFQIADAAEVFNEDIIRPLQKAHHKEGGIAILRGNIAP
jgi:dihydroxy-acid dehydratase